MVAAMRGVYRSVMYQQPISTETAAEVDTPSPMRGLVIAAPLALGLWFGAAELVRLFF